MLVSYDNTVDGDEPATYIVEKRAAARCALLRAASRRCITLLGGEPAVGFRADEHGVSIDLGRGLAAQLRTPLLVAADGRASPAARGGRHQASCGWSYPQIGIVTTVRHEKPHAGAPCSTSCPPVRSPSCR